MKENLVKDIKNKYYLAIEGIKYGLFKVHYGCRRWEGKQIDAIFIPLITS